MNRQSSSGRRSVPHLVCVPGLALLFTFLNAVKPLHIDDTAYYYFARQIARDPLDPYGFEILWYQQTEPANTILAPPLLLYWWASAIRVVGEQPFLWKLWLFPFALVFVFSVDGLLRRFTPGMATPLVCMTVLSPTFLPSLNLMLDIPALALSLSAVNLFLRASDRNSWRWSALAGLVAGLAMQTKYTGFLAPAAMLLYALAAGFLKPASSLSWAARSLLLWLLAAAVAVFIFAAWEYYIACRYGESHFLYHYREQTETIVEKLLKFSLPLLAVLGAVAPTWGLLGLVALKRRAVPIALAGAVIGLGYALVAMVDASFEVPLPEGIKILGWTVPPQVPISLGQIIFVFFGGAVSLVTAVVIWRLLRLGHGGLWRPARWHRHWVEWFLVMWLGLELAGYFALTPFAAVRRVMGLVVVSTLLIGRLASRTCRAPQRRQLLGGVVLGSVLLGVVFYATDLREARARRQAAEEAAAYIRQKQPAAIWYAGHWGFQYYAERAGLKPVLPGESRFHKGDWLIVPDAGIHQQSFSISQVWATLVTTLNLDDPIPFRTVWGFYSTGTVAPLERCAGPRLQVEIYRITADATP